MKAGWKIAKLEEVCDEITDGSHFSPKTTQGGFPYVTVRDLEDDQINFANCKFVGEEDFYRLLANGCKPNKGDILFSKDGTVGKVALIDYEKDFVVLSSLAIVRPDRKHVDSAFLKYVLKSPAFLEEAVGKKTGVAIRRIILRNLKSIPIPVPPLPEQRWIVGVLDEAFEGIATAKATVEKNLQNAHALFENQLQSTFAEVWRTSDLVTLSDLATDITDGDHLPPPKSLTGVPFITIGNIVKETRKIDFTDTHMVPHGYFNGLKPNKKPKQGDVLYTVTGSFGIPVIVNENVQFCFQRHIGLIRPRPETGSRWLYYLLLSPQVSKQANDGATGTAQRTVSLKVLRSIEVPKVIPEQQLAIVVTLDAISIETQRLATLYERKLVALDALKRSLLHRAFAGQLAAAQSIHLQSTVAIYPAILPGITTTDLHAGILAMAFEQHETKGKLKLFTHVKGEKIAHMIEARLGIDLGRAPVKDAAGPNDFPHLKRVEHRARKANFFDFKRVDGAAYQVQKLRGFTQLIAKTRAVLADRLEEVEDLLSWMLRMDVQQAEIVATVFAAWNNLLLDGRRPTDEQIVFEARENWHPDKLRLDRHRFFKAVEWLREEGIVPEGKGKWVGNKEK
jgi:type I restriction enzyme, S subunit